MIPLQSSFCAQIYTNCVKSSCHHENCVITKIVSSRELYHLALQENCLRQEIASDVVTLTSHIKPALESAFKTTSNRKLYRKWRRHLVQIKKLYPSVLGSQSRILSPCLESVRVPDKHECRIQSTKICFLILHWKAQKLDKSWSTKAPNQSAELYSLKSTSKSQKVE